MNNSLLLLIVAAVSVLALMLLYRLARIGYERVLYREAFTETVRESGTGPDTLSELHRNARIRLVMQIILTVVGLGVGFFVLLKGSYSPATENTASGLIGAVLGFWLK